MPTLRTCKGCKEWLPAGSRVQYCDACRPKRKTRAGRDEMAGLLPGLDLAFAIAGARHEGRAERILKHLKKDEPVTVVRDPANEYDPCAMRIVKDGVDLGWVPRHGISNTEPTADNCRLARLMDSGVVPRLTCWRLFPPDAAGPGGAFLVGKADGVPPDRAAPAARYQHGAAPAAPGSAVVPPSVRKLADSLHATGAAVRIEWPKKMRAGPVPPPQRPDDGGDFLNALVWSLLIGGGLLAVLLTR